jgi:hypothetical protein
MKAHFLAFCYIITILLISKVTIAQSVIEKEVSLEAQFQLLLAAQTDETKKEINARIVSSFSEMLNQPETFDYKFTKLKNVGVLTSSDRQVRIYTWNLFWQDGTFDYFGFIQHKNNKKGIDLIQLFDDSKNIEAPEKQVLSNKNWFGALYYEIIDVKDKERTYYTLLAWDGNDLFSNKKLVDVLYFTNSGQAKFGHPIFRRKGRLAKRIVFEYSKTASMALTYDTKLQAIVFDRLVPSKPTFEGNFRFYVTDVTTDGLVLSKDKVWDFVEDIQSMNVESKGLKNRKTEKPIKE